MRFKVLMAMSIKIMVFCDMILSTLVENVNTLEELVPTSSWLEAAVLLKCWYSETPLHNSCMPHFPQLLFITTVMAV